MPWYKLEAWHGPGHQSSTAEYRWFDKRLSDERIKEVWEDFCGAFGGRFDDPIGPPTMRGFRGVLLVKKLPGNIYLEKVEQNSRIVQHGQRMLREVLKVPVPSFEEWYRGFELNNTGARLSEMEIRRALKIAFRAGQESK